MTLLDYISIAVAIISEILALLPTPYSGIVDLFIKQWAKVHSV